ncbi:hypothetical protein CK911_01070 [Aeromonas sp. CU5]|uniref:hypothetical protein n=1 Tax=Aeromonas sp. CU5 TaxID=2033033 RepID=UPI000BFDB942|nr:hypothetical protein [Aeromonas sp. CU5]ATL91548.1 hypothetical protein CK911_01070 [Aeromonas sp. CU5]
MANMRLNANLRTVSFSKTVSVLEELELISGKTVRRYRAVNVHLGTVDVNSDFSLIKELTEADAKNAKLWVQEQQRLVQYAYMENMRRGFLGGSPVIKRSKGDDEQYSDCYGFIPGRKVGEFIGVIIDAIPMVEECSVEKDEYEREYEKVERFRKKGSLSEILDLLLYALKRSNEKVPFSEKEKCDLYCAERVLFYFCTEGMDMKQSKLESASRDKAKDKYKNLSRAKKFPCTKKGSIDMTPV